MNKLLARKRRASRSKAVIKHSKKPRLVVFRSGSHIYGQIIVRSEKGDVVVASSSTLDKELRTSIKGNKSEQAMQVGKHLAKRALDKQVTEVAFDRAGYLYHGRVKALAEGAREAGLIF